jgi:DNA polymerase-3 subunit delta
VRPILDKWLDYTETDRDLRRAADRSAYILTGEEDFLIRQVRDRILTSLISPGAETMDLVKLVGDGRPSSIDSNRLLAEIRTPPLVSNHKVITLDQSGFFAKPGKDHLTAELTDALTSLPENCHLVFTEETVSAAHPLLRKMRRQGALTAKLGRQSLADLQRWISVLCSREELRITREAAESLIQRCESSMADIFNELTTVFLYFRYKQHRDITLSDIDYLCREDLTGKIFDLTDAIAAGRIEQALERLDVLLARREAPLFIQTMLARQTRDLLVASEAGTSDGIIASGVTQSRFFARKLAQQARRFNLERLEVMLENCFQADYAVKTGRLAEEDALSILVIRACGGN